MTSEAEGPDGVYVTLNYNNLSHKISQLIGYLITANALNIIAHLQHLQHVY